MQWNPTSDKKKDMPIYTCITVDGFQNKYAY